MRTRPAEASHPTSGVRARRETLLAPAGTDLDLGPFVVRRFVDFALTESMMCRLPA